MVGTSMWGSAKDFKLYKVVYKFTGGILMLQPSYCENIIVGVIFKHNFNWYITQKDLWKLDYSKLYENIKNQYEEMSFSQKKFEHDVGSFEYFCGARWGISILDQKTADKFFKKINENKIDADKLKEMYISADEDDKVVFLPSLLVDFDNKILYSYFPEYEDFEGFVPDSWTGKYQNFFNLITEKYVYWK